MHKKRFVFLVCLLCVLPFMYGQQPRMLTPSSSSPSPQQGRSSSIGDGDNSDENAIPHQVKAWKIDEQFAIADTVAVDTIPTNFPMQDPINRYSIANAYNGNLGSPLQSKLYFDRTQKNDFLFSRGYDPYFYAPGDFYFFSTRTPYTNIGYAMSYPAEQSEEHLKVIFSLNANKKLNFTGWFDYPYARGRYTNQSAKGMMAALSGSYRGAHYSATGVIAYQSFDNYENGGLQDDQFITHPELYSQYTSITMPVNLGTATPAQSSYTHIMLYYNHAYSIGFTKDVQVTKDSVAEEFIPVTSFIHTLKIDEGAKRFREVGIDTAFFANTYISHTSHTDSAAYFAIKNTFAVRMEEKFNTLLKFGLTAFIENDIRRYMYRNLRDSAMYHWEQNTAIGAVLSKYEGRVFKYDLQGNMVVIGPRIGDTELKGNVGGFFRLGRDSVTLSARARVQSQSASYFMEHYCSNHFMWDNTFSNEFKTYIGGDIAIPTRHIKLGLQIENSTNHLYFDEQAMPVQHVGSVQVIAANAAIDIHAGHFTLENKGVYQLSSNQNVIPLPKLALSHNLYFTATIAKVLQTQIGVSALYNTAYYAPSYMPATGQFFVQNQTKVGGFPLATAYINFHLKQARFFIEYYNANQAFFPNNNYFSMPHYPLNPPTVKVGISVNWYN